MIDRDKLRLALAKAARDEDKLDAIANLRDAPIEGVCKLLLVMNNELLERYAPLVMEAGRLDAILDWILALPDLQSGLSALAAFGPEAARCAPAVGALVPAYEAIQALIGMRMIDANGVARLRATLRGPDVPERETVDRSLAALVAIEPSFADDLLDALRDDTRWRFAISGIAWHGVSPELEAVLERAELFVRLRAIAGFATGFPVAMVERVLDAEPDPKLRGAAYDAAIVGALYSSTAAELLARLLSGPEDRLHPFQVRALVNLGYAKFDDATRYRLYAMAQQRSAFAPFAMNLLPRDAYRGTPQLVSADGTVGASADKTRDHTSYRELEIDHTVTVFEIATRRVLGVQHYNLFETSGGRTGSSPSDIAWGIEPRTLVITVDDGTTDTLRW